MFLDEWLHGEPRSVHGYGALGTAAGTESFPVLDPSKQIHTFMHQLTQPVLRIRIRDPGLGPF
jgi:hypothetical protein